MTYYSIPAEQIGLVSAYVARLGLRARDRWLRSELKYSLGHGDVITLFPVGKWTLSKEKRILRGQGVAEANLVGVARNLAASLAYFNQSACVANGLASAPEVGGKTAEDLYRLHTIYSTRLERLKKRVVNHGEVCASLAEYYLDNPPDISPVAAARLIGAVRANISNNGKYNLEDRVLFDNALNGLLALCDYARMHALSNLGEYQSAPVFWSDDSLYGKCIVKLGGPH